MLVCAHIHTHTVQDRIKYRRIIGKFISLSDETLGKKRQSPIQKNSKYFTHINSNLGKVGRDSPSQSWALCNDFL